MKKFLVKISFTLTILALIAYPLDLVISCQLKRNNSFEGELEVWNDIYNATNNYPIAIYGSSRAWIHVNSKIIEKELEKPTYNYGVNGYHFPMQYFRHQELLRFNNAPELIIITLDATSFQKLENLYNKVQFLPFVIYNNKMQDFVSNYNGFSYTDLNFPLCRYQGEDLVLLELIRDLVNPQSELRYQGFAGKDKKWTKDFIKAKNEFGTIEIVLDAGIIELFNKFISECKSKGIEVVMVYPPEYVDGQNFVSNRDQVINLYERLAARNSLKFLNYSKDQLSYEKKYFYNATHLNLMGANIFTDKLAKDLKKTEYFSDN
ncbi:hypothetical protein [Salegentibacter maritimus]|uniref:hypothetical protein n=1 Tax=Salegentibacter maritimus TaxID=2794347 RepID=UPI0018E49BCE|nr:hypothetical protein [Salegentibacter maritimus]MBI6117463.1 hypothetical protein [Salegentibacter maritimus]